MDKTSVAVYIHIPFCVKKCLYCDFLSFSSTLEQQNNYVNRLLHEIDTFPENNLLVHSIFIGGGTPSSIDEKSIEYILCKLNKKFSLLPNAEITMEVNPGTATAKKLQIYYQAGINRISFGLQSAIDEELRQLGRIHNYKEFLTQYDMARKEGFDNINIDLMSALPGQTIDSWMYTLNQVISLRPEHISAYSLIIEEGTPFYEKYSSVSSSVNQCALPLTEQLPDEDTERRMYELTRERLAEAGYQQYEISNYALQGYECRHNITYWKRGEYIGFGLGASSFYHGKRYHNVKDLSEYDLRFCDNDSIEIVTKKDAMEETMFLGLRMREGILENEFLQKFGHSVDEIYPGVTDRMVQNGLINRQNGRIILTEKGMDLGDYVMTDYMLVI